MIEASCLGKTFGAIRAVTDMSLTVSPGEVLGFLGPNGAGKSTTMKMLTGFLKPDTGRVVVNGVDMAVDPVTAQKSLGYLPEGAPSYPDMTPRAFLSFIAQVRGLTRHTAAHRLEAVCQYIAIGDVLDQPIGTLSRGYKRRVGLAQAILHDPDVLILDEPTDGLDPNQKFAVRALIRTLAPEKAILISTHILEEVDPLCHRVLIVHQGRIVADGTPDSLCARSRYVGAVTMRIPESTVCRPAACLETVCTLPQVRTAELSLHRTGHITVFPHHQTGDQTNHQTGDPELDLKPTLETLARDLGWPDVTVTREEGRLDDVFRTITAGDI